MGGIGEGDGGIGGGGGGEGEGGVGEGGGRHMECQLAAWAAGEVKVRAATATVRTVVAVS